MNYFRAIDSLLSFQPISILTILIISDGQNTDGQNTFISDDQNTFELSAFQSISILTILIISDFFNVSKPFQ